jgi:RHS repeat-associated protein
MLSSTLGTNHKTFTHQGITPRINTATGLTGTMSYDAAGNELKSPAGIPSDGSPAAAYSPRNLLSSQFVREYDRCQEEIGSACFQADPVQEWRSNVYDGRGVRVLSIRNIVSLSGTISIGNEEPQPDLYFYTPELTMMNIVTPTRTADVIWFGSRPVADHGEGGVRYTFTDHLGTPILQTTSTAAVTWRAEYEPFGDVYALRAGSASDDQPLRFPGQQVAYRTAAGEETYNIFRWYRAEWGRYSQADPIGIGDTPYVYADLNPVLLKDPLGLYTVTKNFKTKALSSPEQICGSTYACTLLGAAVGCSCSCTGDAWRASISVLLTGTIYHFNGNFGSLKKKPKDPSVKDASSAIAHEHAFHIDPALKGIDEMLRGVEETWYVSKEDCQSECAKVSKDARDLFFKTLQKTQADENK